jgi:hypothetical protein
MQWKAGVYHKRAGASMIHEYAYSKEGVGEWTVQMETSAHRPSISRFQQRGERMLRRGHTKTQNPAKTNKVLGQGYAECCSFAQAMQRKATKTAAKLFKAELCR